MPARRQLDSTEAKLWAVRGARSWRGLRCWDTRCSGHTGQALVYELDHGSALADRGRAALDRACAHVASRVDARHARLEKALGADLRAGQDEAVAVARKHVTEPLGARLGAKEQEHK
jgi:hypothetical protein